MSLLINDFKRGWQNRARHELMYSDAVYVATNADFDELGAIRCRQKHGEHSALFKHTTFAAPVGNLYQLDVEGINKQLIYCTTPTAMYRWNSTTNVLTLISYAFTSSNHVSYAALKPELSTYTYVYMTDGSTLLTDNGTSTKTWGIDPPESAVDVGIDTLTGQLTAGDYSYVYTFWDESTGSESDPSPACAAISVGANESVDVSNIEVSTNSRITSRKLYRTIANGGTRYLVAIIPDNVVTSYTDVVPDSQLTLPVTTDQGVPPSGDVVVALKNTLFLAGDVDYKNRIRFCVDRNPDNWPSTYYVEVGHGGMVVQNILVMDGMLYAVTRTGVVAVLGNDPDNYDTSETKATLGTYARWSCATVGGGLYYLTTTGIRRFDGVKSEDVSLSIARLFEKSPSSLHSVVDTNLAQSRCRTAVYRGRYYLLVPLKDTTGDIENKILEFDPTEQRWRLIDTYVEDILGDDSNGVLFGSARSGFATSGATSVVYDLLQGDTGVASDVVSMEVVTKNYDFTAAPEAPVKQPEVSYGMKSSRVIETSWVKEFRIDARGSWTFEFFVDGVSRHTATLSDLTQADAQVWRSFPSRIKGRYMYVKCTATGAGPTSHKLYEIEVS